MPEEPKKPAAIDRLIARETREVETGDILDEEGFGLLSEEEKAQYLYGLVIGVRQARVEGYEDDAHENLREIKAVMKQYPETMKLFSQVFSRARAEAKVVEQSPLFRKTVELSQKTAKLSGEHDDLYRRVNLGEIKGSEGLDRAIRKLSMLSMKIDAQQKERERIVTLDEMNVDVMQEDGTMKKEKRNIEHTKENTDIAALENYYTLRRYHDEGEGKGFVWLPELLKIKKKLLTALDENGLFPTLVGEPGVGKSEIVKAVSYARTGQENLKILCNTSTSERELVSDVDIQDSSRGLVYGVIPRALTGWASSSSQSPECETGRIVFIDEPNRANESKIFGTLKEAMQCRVGESYNSSIPKPVRPGGGIVLAMNPAGDRHKLAKFSAALEGELRMIEMDYPPMTHGDPQTYEFLLARLMNKRGYIPLPQEEISPAYFEKEVSGDASTADGRAILREQIVVSDPTDKRHGALYRLAFAARAIQDAYIAHNPDEILNYKDTLLRFDSTSKKIVESGGAELTLESTRFTLGIIGGWMEGFWARKKVQGVPERYVNTLSEWLSYKAKKYIAERSEYPEDQEKLEAIFDHFGILDPELKMYDKKPMTHLEIGYLSPRVPRPLIVEEKAKTEHPVGESESEAAFRDRNIESDEYLTTEGESVRVMKKEAEYEAFGGNSVVLVPDQTIRFFNERNTWQEGIFAGLTEDKNAIAIRVGKLVQVSDKESFEKAMKEGAATELLEVLEKDTAGFYKEGIEDECGAECLSDTV